MSAILIKIVVLTIIIGVGSFFIGNLICSLGQKERGINKSIIYGFTILLALYEVLAIPAILLKVRFSMLSNIYSVMTVICIVFGVFYFFYRKDFVKYKFSMSMLKGDIIGKIIILLLIGIQIYAGIFLEHTDADDGYYVTISNIAIEQDEICLEGNSVYTGVATENAAVRPEVAAWELFVAYLCQLVNVHPAVMCHTMLPAVLVILCYMVIYELGKSLFQNHSNAIKFVILYAVLNIFGGYSVHSTGCFLLLRLWQGKAMMVNFAFPMIVLNCLDIYHKKDNIVTWMLNFAIVCMGTMFTVVGLYLMPIYYFVVGAPLIIKRFVQKRLKEAFVLIRNAFFSLFPTIVLLAYSFLCVINSESGQSYMSRQSPTWSGIFNMVHSKTMIVLLLISMVIIIIKGNAVSKMVFAGSTVVLLLTFLNPLLTEIVAQKITGVDVYWRLHWMIPMYVAIAYGFVLICEEATGRLQGLVLAMLLVILVYSGEPIYSEKYFTKMTNAYKLPTQVLLIGDNLPEGSKCIIPDHLSYYMRQYTSEVKLVQARGMVVNFNNIENTEYSYSWLYDQIYTYGLVNEPTITNLLDVVEVDYVYYTDVIIIKGDKSNIIMLDDKSGLVKINK